jgi:hypothetical protein
MSNHNDNINKNNKLIDSQNKDNKLIETKEPIDSFKIINSNSSEPNMFDLTSIIGIQKEQEIKQMATTVSTDEQKNLLIDYEEISSEKWDSIQQHTHIRYLRKDGSFRRGGYVKNVWVGIYGNTKGKKCIQIATSLSFKAAKWTVCFDDIEKIWQQKEFLINSKKNIIAPEVNTILQSNKESIEYLTRTVEQLKIDIAKINNEQSRMVNLIKKMYNIKSKPQN